MSNYILGIDPGFKGGIALLDVETGEIEALWPMPLRTSSGLFTVKRNEIHLEELTLKIQGYGKEILFSVLEQVGASPQMGVTSAFRFGEGFGVVKGILAGLDIKVQVVYPAVWKGVLGLPAEKSASLRKATEHWPLIGKEIFTVKKNDGLAEAALLARYGWTQFYKEKLAVVAVSKNTLQNMLEDLD